MNFQTIPRNKIIIKEGRQRQEFDPEAANELAETMHNKGLMHAPVLRNPTPDEDYPADCLVLVAGERRIRSLELNWFLNRTVTYNGVVITEGTIPYVNLGDLSPMEAEEAELDENLHRKDLTWQERSTAMAKLHNLRSRQALAEGRIQFNALPVFSAQAPVVRVQRCHLGVLVAQQGLHVHALRAVQARRQRPHLVQAGPFV